MDIPLQARFFKPLDKVRKAHGLAERLKQYSSNVLLLCCALLLYSKNKYYVQFLNPKALFILKIYACSYIVVGFIYYTFIAKKLKSETKGYVVLRVIETFLVNIRHYIRAFTLNPQMPVPKLDKSDKNNLLFVLVKLFFLPIMLNFCIGNFSSVQTCYGKAVQATPNEAFGINTFNDTIYPLIYYLIFLIDTTYFTFGYMFEADFLGNRVRSVEPTVFGWIAAILCYPPFNGFMDNYIKWYATDNPAVSNIYVTFVLRMIILLLFLIYLWATISLGTKSSNLTNRGIVSKGPYSIVRHPAYISKNLAWFVSIIPVFSIQAVLNMAVWAFLYYLRAITEERHLIKDPDYQQYCRKVRYRFIPYIW